MKHLLNNLSEEEKNSIREQHVGGMKVTTENFLKLVNSKSGTIKETKTNSLNEFVDDSNSHDRIKEKYSDEFKKWINGAIGYYGREELALMFAKLIDKLNEPVDTIDIQKNGAPYLDIDIGDIMKQGKTYHERETPSYKYDRGYTNPDQ